MKKVYIKELIENELYHLKLDRTKTDDYGSIIFLSERINRFNQILDESISIDDLVKEAYKKGYKDGKKEQKTLYKLFHSFDDRNNEITVEEFLNENEELLNNLFKYENLER